MSNTESFVDNFFWSLWYNGYHVATERLAVMLESTNRLFLSDEQRKEIVYEEENMMQLLWMILVQMFGDYGCSPRGGWVDDTSGAAEFIRKYIERTWDYNDE